jgi:hypothetical protein
MEKTLAAAYKKSGLRGEEDNRMAGVGQSFRLKRTTIATVMQDGKRIAVQIPAAARIIAVDPVPEHIPDDRRQQVNVRWNGKDLIMFLIDIQERGERIQTARKVTG